MKSADVTIRLLGAYRVELSSGQPAVFRSNSERALLAYLAADPESHRRDSLSALLWPETDDKRARGNLRVSLHRARQAINDPAGRLLQVSQREVHLDEDRISVDARLFTEAISRIEQHKHKDLHSCVQCKEDLNIAADLYGGEFLKGFSPKDNQPFLEWKTIKQEQFHRAALQCHFQLADMYAARQEFALAERHARRQLDLEPWREIAHRQLMTILSAMGERSGALAQYEICRRVLKDELGLEPSDQTRAIFDRIRAGEAQGVRNVETKPGAEGTSSKTPQIKLPQWVALAGIGLVAAAAIIRQFGFSSSAFTYDDFNDAQHDGSFDSAKWIEPTQYGPACEFFQQNGELLISEAGPGDSLGCTLSVKRPPSTLGAQLGSMSARLKLGENHDGGVLAAVLRFATELHNDSWSALLWYACRAARPGSAIDCRGYQQEFTLRKPGSLHRILADRL